jgi:cation transport ATPase
VNDAPALKKANVGIAVAGATAAAKGAADITLTQVSGRLPAWRLISAACSALGVQLGACHDAVCEATAVHLVGSEALWDALMTGLSLKKAVQRVDS